MPGSTVVMSSGGEELLSPRSRFIYYISFPSASETTGPPLQNTFSIDYGPFIPSKRFGVTLLRGMFMAAFSKERATRLVKYELKQAVKLN